MTILGMPLSMFLVFVATILAGCIGAVHYLIVHVLMGRPFAEVPLPVVRENPDVARRPEEDELHG